MTAAYLKGTESALFCTPWKSTFSEIITALRLALLLLVDMGGELEGGKLSLLPLVFLCIYQLHRILSFIVISLHTHIPHSEVNFPSCNTKLTCRPNLE